MNIITAENINKNFHKHIALSDITANIREGVVFGLLGPNGAGKTTFIRIINNIIAPDSGNILFKNEVLNFSHNKNIGYLPEERGLYRKMKVGEQAIYMASLKGIKRKEAKKKLLYYFEKFEISAWWNRKAEELSKGMQQKIQFIITILHNPDLLIFDEPFSGFDPINTQMLKDEILELKKQGKTIIFSAHNMLSVEEICDEIMLINKSKKVIDGNLQEIKNNYKTNIYKVTFKGNIDNIDKIIINDYQIANQLQKNDVNILEIKSLKNANSKEIIDILNKNFKIVAFEEKLPSLNDIFIKLVKEDIDEH